MGSVQRADAPQQLVSGMPGYPVGLVLIARLAVDEREQGAGLGTRLFADALRMAVMAGRIASARRGIRTRWWWAYLAPHCTSRGPRTRSR
jgi:GNAT superfamily N-acetyltransferase